MSKKNRKRKRKKEEENKGIKGKILIILSPILIIGLLVLIICALIATIVIVQKTNGKMPFTLASILSKAIKCKHPDGKFDCKRGGLADEKEKFTIVGWKRDSEGSKPLQSTIKGTFSLLDTMLLMVIDNIGNALFDPNEPNNLDRLFNVDGKPPALGIGNSILVVLKLAAIFAAFFFYLVLRHLLQVLVEQYWVYI